MDITSHARSRAVQRNLPADIVATIFAYGASRKAPGQAVRLVFDRESITLEADGSCRRLSELARYSGVYLVLGKDGRIVTIARRHRRWFN